MTDTATPMKVTKTKAVKEPKVKVVKSKVVKAVKPKDEEVVKEVKPKVVKPKVVKEVKPKVVKEVKPKVVKEVKPKVVKEVKEPKEPKMPKKAVDPDFIITIAHIKKYMNKYRINKEIDELIEQVKRCQKQDPSTQLPLKDILHEDVLKRIADFKENLNKADRAKLDLKDEYKQAIHALSIFKHKFSGNAFTIVAYVLNLTAREIIINTLEKTYENKKRSLVPKFIPWDILKNKMMSGMYLNTKTVIDTLADADTVVTKPVEEVVDETDETDEVDETDDVDDVDETDETKPRVSIEVKLGKYNLRHFLHKLCKDVISSDERFNKFKINGTFIALCNKVLIDVMERYIKMIYILVNIANNKTINDKIFLAITKIMIEDNNTSVESDQDVLYQMIESKLESMKLDDKSSNTDTIE